MSNALTATNIFTVYNYTNSELTSGYALSLSPFTFILSSTSNTFAKKNLTNKVLWDFGDGTTSTGITASHVYDFPGVYTVTNYIYTSSGDVYLNTYTNTVTVFNFVTDALTLTATFQEDCLATETAVCVTTEAIDVNGKSITPSIILVEPSGANKYYLRASRIENPFKLIRTNSWQTWPSLSSTDYSIVMYSSGGDPNYFAQKLNTNKYGHLYPYSSFFIKQNNEFIETSSVIVSSTPLYCKLVGSNIEYCKQTDEGSVFCGTSGSEDIYFKTDTQTERVLLYASFEANTFHDLYGTKYYPFKYGSTSSYFGYLNTFGVGISAAVLPNLEYKDFTITSTGLDGEGNNTSVFDIDQNKFVGLPINFVVRIKDLENFSVKSIPILSASNLPSLNNIQIDVVSRGIIDQPETDTILTPEIGTITSNFKNLSSLKVGGFFKGKFTPVLSATDVCFRVKGNVGYVNNNGQQILYSLINYSNKFNIFSNVNEYNIAKQNENIDFQETLKELRLQESLTNTDIFFDDFLGTIYGNISSNSFTMGKVAYEKTANFVSNKIDINTCDIDSLYSYGEMLNLKLTDFNKYKFQIPARIRRLIDIFSINYTRLRGTRNQYNLNFNKNSFINTSKYGLNLGNILNITTTVLSAVDGYIVAREKFSGDYVLCTTRVLTATLDANGSYNSTNNTYPLSDYNENWGWGLETAGVSGIKVERYYQFYTYRPTKVYYNNNEITDGGNITLSGTNYTIYHINYNDKTILLVSNTGDPYIITEDNSSFMWSYVDNSFVNGVINYNDITNNFSYTLTSYNDLIQKQGIIDNMLNYNLYKGLELLS